MCPQKVGREVVGGGNRMHPTKMAARLPNQEFYRLPFNFHVEFKIFNETRSPSLLIIVRSGLEYRRMSGDGRSKIRHELKRGVGSSFLG